MAGQTYTTQAARIGKLKGEILKRAIPREVLSVAGQTKQMPKNKGNQVVYRRYYPYGGTDNVWVSDGGDATLVAAHVLAEGVTPSADSITATDVTATLTEYGALYSYSNKVGELYEDDIPAEMIRQVADRIALTREMVRFGALKAGTTVVYGGAGTSAATVNGAVGASKLRSAKRTLEKAHAEMVTDILAPSPNFGTSSIEAAFLCFAHTDMESDIRDLPKFVPVADYGSRKTVHAREIGSWENFRFILSPELTFWSDTGATAAGTGLKTSGTKVDVYPLIITGMDAWGTVALRGLDSIDPTHLPYGDKQKGDPLGQRGYVGARTWFDCTVLNQGWMVVGKFGVTDL